MNTNQLRNNASRQANGLKGQHNLAQGKRRRSVALGCNWIFKFVRVQMHANEPANIRTKWRIENFLADNLFNSVRNKAFILNNLISRTASSSPLRYPGFDVSSAERWRFGSFLPKLCRACPDYFGRLLYFGLSGRKNIRAFQF